MSEPALYQSLDSKTVPNVIGGDGEWRSIRFTDSTPTGPAWSGPVVGLSRLPILADGLTTFDVALFTNLRRVSIDTRPIRPWVQFLRAAPDTKVADMDSTHWQRLPQMSTVEHEFGQCFRASFRCRRDTPIVIRFRHYSGAPFVIEQAMVKWWPE